jgi:hypothetical protein
MGLGQTHKQEFKMKSTYITKERGRLMQIECKWCGGLNKDNFKHKFYMAHNLQKETPFPSL